MKPLARPLLWSLVVALFVTVSCEEIKLNGFTKCVNLPKPPSDVVNTDGKSVQYDSCAVKIKDYDKVIGKYEKQRRELETGISKSNDKTAREKMQKELKSDYFFKIGLYTLVGFAVATFLSLTALIFNWYTLFWVTFRVSFSSLNPLFHHLDPSPLVLLEREDGHRGEDVGQTSLRRRTHREALARGRIRREHQRRRDHQEAQLGLPSDRSRRCWKVAVNKDKHNVNS
ncbi:hypothetical protein L596_022872 [Steinernema carpocapsae]|uniref:Uncharacterized protein n=1 Tax=Steinernema carpocapsae TaxID=34508 RepID=A0A4U5MBU2_STECR|nr:hypothetical protein L596_022872 [Steinernema carpocapsae]